MSKGNEAFAAIADPTRRAILELLAARGSCNAGEIADEFPKISRPAVSKHLGVLRRARLVRARQSGREWRYTIDPRPLERVYRAWLEQFAPMWEASLQRLKERAEE